VKTPWAQPLCACFQHRNLSHTRVHIQRASSHTLPHWNSFHVLSSWWLWERSKQSLQASQLLVCQTEVTCTSLIWGCIYWKTSFKIPEMESKVILVYVKCCFKCPKDNSGILFGSLFYLYWMRLLECLQTWFVCVNIMVYIFLTTAKKLKLILK
jgi:hypothetical protein